MTDIPTPNPKLRIAHVIVQPVLMLDDGEGLMPGPTMNPSQVPLSALATIGDEIREAVAKFEADHAAT